MDPRADLNGRFPRQRRLPLKNRLLKSLPLRNRLLRRQLLKHRLLHKKRLHPKPQLPVKRPLKMKRRLRRLQMKQRTLIKNQKPQEACRNLSAYSLQAVPFPLMVPLITSIMRK